MILDWFRWLYLILDNICQNTGKEQRKTDKPANIEIAFRIMILTKVWVSLPLPDP